MKTKKSIWSIALSLVMVFALILGISLNTQAKTVQAENEEYITFDVRVDTVESKSVPAGYAGALEVTYTVTETTGVDALQLRLGYDHDAFTLDSVVTNNDTTLGTATKGQEDFLENVVYENTNTEGATFIVGAEDESVLLITATFYLNQPTPATAYTFSIYNANSGNDYSNAWRINKAEDQSATHTPVEIKFANEAIVYVQGTYDFTLTGNTKIYDGAKAQDSEITISATGTNAPTLKLVWFDANYNKLEENPTNVGTYYVVAETEGNAYWQAYAGYTGNENDGYTLTNVEGKVATYTITPQTVNVTIDNKSSAYGEALVALTHNGAEYLGINLSTTADNTVPGTYPITGTASNANYTVNFTNGTYTVTKKSVTVTIADKSSAYGAQLAELTHDGAEALGVTLSTTATSSSNVGTYPITGDWTNKTNYDVTFVGGTYTITSVGKDADYVKSFFSGATVEFDAASHNLLIVDANKPDWIGYNAENNNQTNANTYQITVNILVSAQDAKNYIDATLVGDQNYVATVEGKITPKAIVVTPDNKSHIYGQNPETLTPATVGLNNEVTVIFTVKDANEETIELSKTTPVDEYAIVPSATNTNYAFTFNNGTYTVSKANAVITVSAEDVFYNRGYNYSATAKANDVDVAKTIVVKDANGNVVDTTSVLDAGTYTVEVTVAGTDNYNGAVETKTFKVKKIAVAAPTVTYNGSTATWTVVENDAGAENVTAKALYNSDVTYTIGENEYSNREFTPSAAGNYILVITPSNTNYTPVEVELATVYSVTFTEGSHPASTATAANMPGAQYVFNGQKATQPANTPTLTGYTFSAWDFDFNTAITANTEIPALWTINQITMTVVYIENVNYTETSRTFQADYNSEIAISTYNLKLQIGLNGDNDNMATAYNLNGMHYEFNNLWSYKVTGEDEYIETEIHQVPVNATQPYTFVAVYTATPIDYEITYMLKIDNGSYAQYGEVQTVAYNAVINYANLENVAWFRAETWYTDGERTISAPANMPAGNLTVYGAYVFNIGLGDVNADGNVGADDITLYRKWIVGGYEIAEVASGNEYALATSNDFNANNTYFLTRVADDNAATLEATVLGDTYLDIRDVSTIRMAMVGGYGFSILEGNTVDGEGIYVTRTIAVESASDLLMVARSGQKVELNADINEPNFVAVIEDAQKDIIIDLKGHTLNLKSFRVTLAQGNTGKILITNGRINVADGNGVYLTAVDGSVHLDNVTLYDDNGLFVIQTANHSLHLFNVVKFLKKDVNAANNEAPAEVLVVKDSHIVVEETAELEIAKVVVAEIVEINEEEHVVPVAEESDAQITISNNSAAVEEIPVQDNKFENTISNAAELVAAAAKGGEYKVVADFTVNQMVTVDKALTLNGENHTITFNKQDNGNYAFNVDDNHTAQVIAEFNNLNIVSTGYQVAILLNSDFHSRVTLNNVDITCDGECVYSNGLGTVNAIGCEFTHEGEYATGKDFVYYSALIVGYGGTINATNCEVLSFGNGIATFPSGGSVNLVNTNIEVNEELTSADAGYAVWARNEDYTNYPEYLRDSIITFDGCEVTGKLKITDKYTEGSKNKYASKIVVKNSTLSDTNVVIDSGLQLVVNTINGETTYSVAKSFVVTNEEELRTALDNKASLIVFGNDISSTDGYLVDYNTTIDLGGYTLTVETGSSVNSRAIKIATGAELTVLNGTVDALGTKTSGCFGAFRAEVNSTLNLKDLTLKNYRGNGLNVKVLGATATLENVNITSVYGGGIEVTDDEGADGTVTGYAVLRNCVMTQSDYYDWCSTAVSVSGNSTLDVYSTSYTGEYGLYVFSSGGTINVYGGEFTATGHNVIQTSYDGSNYGNDAIVNIYGGSFTGTFGIGNSGHEFLNIYGGSFDHDPTAYLADGYYYTVSNDLYVVQEGIHTYAQLVEAAANGGDYTLTADIDLEETVVVTKDMTLRLNGHRIYNTTDLWVGDNWSLISVRNGANLTIKGDNGILDAKENDCFALDVCDNGTITLDGNGTYIGNISAVYACEGFVTINGGSFDLKQLDSGSGEARYRYELNCLDASYKNGTSNFTVNSGSFNYFNPANNLSEGANTNYVPEGYYAVEDNGVYTIEAGITGSGQDPIVGPGPNPSFPF